LISISASAAAPLPPKSTKKKVLAKSPLPVTADAIPVLNETLYGKLAETVPVPQLHEMYAMCLNDVRRRIGIMRQMAAERDGEQFVREAHAIKGGCGMLGATELHRMAAQLESDGIVADNPDAEQKVNSLDELSAACDRLERMLGSRV
jgi:HPt (histidine-containing phosphotransfer) domain-containing protein